MFWTDRNARLNGKAFTVEFKTNIEGPTSSTRVCAAAYITDKEDLQLKSVKDLTDRSRSRIETGKFGNVPIWEIPRHYRAVSVIGVAS